MASSSLARAVEDDQRAVERPLCALRHRAGGEFVRPQEIGRQDKTVEYDHREPGRTLLEGVGDAEQTARAEQIHLTEKDETQLLDRFVKNDGWLPLEFLEEVSKASKLKPSDPFVKLLRDIQTIEFTCWFKFICLLP